MKAHFNIILFFLFCFSYKCTAQADCTGADYHLNGNAVDSSWHHYNGIMNGTTPTSDRFGQIDNAIHFNGVFDYILLPNLFDYERRSIRLWFLAENIGITEQTLYVSDCNFMQFGRTSISVCTVGGTKKINFDAGGIQYSYPILENQWYMAAITVNVDSTKFYLNGSLLSTQITGSMHSPDGIYHAIVGSNNNVNDNYFEGKIDQLDLNPCVIAPGPFTGIINTEVKNSSSIMVFPNPATSNIKVISKDIEKENTFCIYNNQGQLKQCSFNCSDETLIDITTFEPGIYLLRITGTNSTSVVRFVKE